VVHKPSPTILNFKDVRQVYVCEREKIVMSSQSKHCLVDNLFGRSWGSTRSVGPAYRIDTRRETYRSIKQNANF